MEHLIPIIADPTVRQIVGPAMGNGLKWALDAARARFSHAPEAVQDKARANTDAFAELLAAKVAAKMQSQENTREAINDELATPKGMVSLQRAIEVSAEVEDQFTRENLAELVSRRLTVRGATRLQLGTRIATEALGYLTEPYLRLAAFMAFTQSLRPGGTPSDESSWTQIVADWMRGMAHALLLEANSSDLAMLSSAGLVDVMPDILEYDLAQHMRSPQGFVPNLQSFLTSDPAGMKIGKAWGATCRYRLNIAGVVLGITAFDIITGTSTDLSKI